MARAGHAYPQVEPGIRALVDRRVVACVPRCTVARALHRARRTGARVVVLGRASAVKERELARASRWGLGRTCAREIAWRGLPSLPDGAREVSARRLLLAGAPLVLVRHGGRVVGVVDADQVELNRPEPLVLSPLERAGDRAREGRLWLLRVAGKVGEGMGMPVYAVGGFVRDLLLGATGPDLDLVVEGDGIAFARRLAEEIGGNLAIHPGFGTASIEGGRGLAGNEGRGTLLGRVDVASARRERYEARGALPAVTPASLGDDLRRRDFSVNAMAVALGPDRFGRLVDPFCGQRDVRQRRLRLLHLLSFVEDPTRIFRAARYAARLGFRLDASAVRAMRLALGLRAYPALSGRRLRTEIDLLAVRPRSRPAFELLIKWGALTLCNIDSRKGRRITRKLADMERFSRWAGQAGVAVEPAEVALLALLAGERPSAVGRCLDRLAITGAPRARLEAAAAAAPLARRLEQGGLRPSLVAEALRAASGAVLCGAWLLGGRRARQHIQWYLAHGRAVRPLLSGEDLLALGVPRGPRVGEGLRLLRRLRLDGALGSLAQEREFVKEWLTAGKEA